jgi:hypothetical protein
MPRSAAVTVPWRRPVPARAGRVVRFLLSPNGVGVIQTSDAIALCSHLIRSQNGLLGAVASAPTAGALSDMQPNGPSFGVLCLGQQADVA